MHTAICYIYYSICNYIFGISVHLQVKSLKMRCYKMLAVRLLYASFCLKILSSTNLFESHVLEK